MRVTGLITQGAKRIGSPEYVKSYKVASSDDGKTWRTYKVKGTDGDMVSCARTHTHARTPTATHCPFPLVSLMHHVYTLTYTQTCLYKQPQTASGDHALSQGQIEGRDEMAF